MVHSTVSGFLEHQIEKVGKEMRKMMWPDSTE
jgi:preprotein translocase subunit SecE